MAFQRKNLRNKKKKQRNVKKAQEQGIYGIVFQNSKQLKEELKENIRY